MGVLYTRCIQGLPKRYDDTAKVILVDSLVEAEFTTEEEDIGLTLYGGVMLYLVLPIKKYANQGRLGI